MTLYIPPRFRVDDRARLVAFIERHAFGTLVCAGADGLQASHLPFLVEQGGDGRVRLLAHEARANGQLAALEGARDVLAIFEGPHGYVSPTWYEHHPAVPTWNYSVVHARGRVRMLDAAATADIVARLSEKYEAGHADPWRMDALPAKFRDAMLEQIGGFALEVETLEGKFKLSQNRPGRDAARVIDALEARGERELAALMREQQSETQG